MVKIVYGNAIRFHVQNSDMAYYCVMLCKSPEYKELFKRILMQVTEELMVLQAFNGWTQEFKGVLRAFKGGSRVFNGWTQVIKEWSRVCNESRALTSDYEYL
jgi:hypothetical protein